MIISTYYFFPFIKLFPESRLRFTNPSKILKSRFPNPMNKHIYSRSTRNKICLTVSYIEVEIRIFISLTSLSFLFPRFLLTFTTFKQYLNFWNLNKPKSSQASPK